MTADATPLPRLVAITEATVLAGDALLRQARWLVGAALPGSVAVLLRDHATSARSRLEVGRELRTLTRDGGQALWVADRLDLALALRADGVHLGEASVSAPDARALVGAELVVSRAQHGATLPAPERAERQGVDALLLSPVMEARKGRAALGVEALAELRASLAAEQHSGRVYALGGVTAANARRCLEAGAWGVAAIGAAWGSRASALLEALEIAS